MKKISFISVANDNFDVAGIFATAFARLGIDVEVLRIPYFLLVDLSKERLRSIVTLIKEKSTNSFVIFFPDTSELFLQAGFMLMFSAYRTWFNSDRMRVIPHLWTPAGTPENRDEWRWNDKPPLRIGFMGRSHESSRVGRIGTKLPRAMREWLLEGNYLRHPWFVAALNDIGVSTVSINTFARIETILALRAADRNNCADVRVEEPYGNTLPMDQKRKSEYKDHLHRNTYIVCPRGTENYSFRIYEALEFGRIPVILDTETVLPTEVDWERLSLVVPYRSLEKIHEVILEDYESRSRDDFLARQTEAFATMTALRTMRWVDKLATEIAFAGGIEI